MLIRAGALIESTNRVHRPGHLRMEKGKILAVGSNLVPLPGEEILSIPEITLAPGWINLHAHLELSALYGVLYKGTLSRVGSKSFFPFFPLSLPKCAAAPSLLQLVMPPIQALPRSSRF